MSKPPMGRPRGSGAYGVTLHARITTEQAATIDAMPGETRAERLRALIDAATPADDTIFPRVERVSGT